MMNYMFTEKETMLIAPAMEVKAIFKSMTRAYAKGKCSLKPGFCPSCLMHEDRVCALTFDEERCWVNGADHVLGEMYADCTRFDTFQCGDSTYVVGHTEDIIPVYKALVRKSPNHEDSEGYTTAFYRYIGTMVSGVRITNGVCTMVGPDTLLTALILN